MTRTLADKRALFRQMHQDGCFVIPNPWDRGSARYLQSLGFKALATTSSGFAWTRARADEAMALDDVLAHLRDIVDAVDLPVNADFENGFADAPEQVAANVRRAIETGIAGLSIEDATRAGPERYYPLPLAVDRIKAARAAIDASGSGVLLVGRSEAAVENAADLAACIARLQAYSDAGADCLYAPFLTTAEQIGAVVRAAAPKPVNVLNGKPGLTVAQLASLGVRRVSVGGALARTAWGGFTRAAEELARDGTFGGFANAASGKTLNALFNA